MPLAPYLSQTNLAEEVTVKFRFLINGTSDPDALMPHMKGVSEVTRSGPGVFVATMSEKYPVFLGLTGNVMGDSGATLGLVVQGDFAGYDSATGLLTFRTVDTYTDATPAAADPTDNDWVYVEATFCRRSTLCPSGAI